MDADEAIDRTASGERVDIYRAKTDQARQRGIFGTPRALSSPERCSGTKILWKAPLPGAATGALGRPETRLSPRLLEDRGTAGHEKLGELPLKRLDA